MTIHNSIFIPERKSTSTADAGRGETEKCVRPRKHHPEATRDFLKLGEHSPIHQNVREENPEGEVQVKG